MKFSIKRWMLRLWSIVHFGMSSVGAFALDKAIFATVCFCLSHWSTLSRSVYVPASLIVARFLSSNVNYYYNRRAVFKSRTAQNTFIKYWGLCLVLLAFSATLTTIIVERVDVEGVKIVGVNFLVECVTFLLSYFVQKCIIFKE